MYNVFDNVIAFENGELDQDQVTELFSHLIKSGLAWQLQGSYGRTAYSFIVNGVLDAQGNILCASCT